MVKSVFAVSLVIGLAVGMCQAAYPERPIRFIVPAVAGSAPDITSRLTTVEMTTLLGQQFVVDNRGGAGGTLGMPLIAFCYANAHAIILQLLGGQWLPSVAIFRALAPAAACMTITAAVGWIFLSTGRARRHLRWSIITTAITLIAFVAGTRWGVVGVAAAFSLTRVLLLIPTLIFTCVGSIIRWVDILSIAARPAVQKGYKQPKDVGEIPMP